MPYQPGMSSAQQAAQRAQQAAQQAQQAAQRAQQAQQRFLQQNQRHRERSLQYGWWLKQQQLSTPTLRVQNKPLQPTRKFKPQPPFGRLRLMNKIRCPSCGCVNQVQGNESQFSCQFGHTNINVLARQNELFR